MQKVRYSNKFLDCDLTAENALAFRRLVGQEKKDRSDMVNMGVNMILVQTGKL
mgnify:CR=1 FL=1